MPHTGSSRATGTGGSARPDTARCSRRSSAPDCSSAARRRLTCPRSPPQLASMRARRRLTGLVVAGLLAAPALAQQVVEPVDPAPHILPWPDLGTGRTEVQNQASLNLGPELQ